MAVVIDKVDGAVVIAVEGQINSANAPALETDLLSRIDQGERRVVLDLGLLSYISSAGLRVVLMMAKRLRQSDGKLVLCGLQSRVREVFDISGFLAILTVVETREDALRLTSGE